MYIYVRDEIGEMIGKCRQCKRQLLPNDYVWKGRNQLYCNYECFKARQTELSET